MKKTFQVGERVRYSHAFLRNTGCFIEPEIADMRGTVEKIIPHGSNDLIKVLWDKETEAKGCLASNLAHMNYDATE